MVKVTCHLGVSTSWKLLNNMAKVAATYEDAQDSLTYRSASFSEMVTATWDR